MIFLEQPYIHPYTHIYRRPVTITFVSIITAVMLAIWFRYACSLILLSGRSRRAASVWAEAKKLHLHEIAPRLEAPLGRTELIPLERTVHSDYRMVTYMLRNGSEFHPLGEASLECKMLYLHYRASQLLFHLANLCTQSAARAQLSEMTRVVHHLASHMVQRAEPVN